MILSNIVKVTKPYSGTSKFEFWHNIHVNDILTISVNLKPSGRGRSGLYSQNITVTNETDGKKFTDGWNNTVNYLQKLEYEEIK